MRSLYAPWRMEYIGTPPDPGCLFCRVREAQPEDDRRNLVLHRAPDALVMLNKFPYNPGHLMVAPRAHQSSLSALADDQVLAMMRLVQHSEQVLERVMSPEGFNVGVNLGRAAGALLRHVPRRAARAGRRAHCRRRAAGDPLSRA